MEYLTHSLIDKSEVLQIVKKLKAEKSSWQDGKMTAGSHAAKIERKIQMRNALLTAASFAFVLAIGSAAPLGLSFSDGVQLTE